MTNFLNLIGGLAIGFFAANRITDFKNSVGRSGTIYVVTRRANGSVFETRPYQSWLDAIEYTKTIQNPAFRWEITTNPYAERNAVAGVTADRSAVGVDNARAGSQV